MKNPLDREILLAFWKVHILHHAAVQPIYGLWMIEELAEHGHHISPGTLYPLLARMLAHGWLRSESGEHPKGRCTYRITKEGQRVLERLRGLITELHQEVVLDAAVSPKKNKIRKKAP